MLQFFYGDYYDLILTISFTVLVLQSERLAGTPARLSEVPSLATTMRPFRDNVGHYSLERTERARPSYEVHKSMYILADEYGCENLRSHVLSKFDQCPLPHAFFPRVFSGAFGTLIDHDNRLRLVVATKLARCYERLRAEQRTNEWLGEWLTSDPELAMLVMDHLSKLRA